MKLEEILKARGWSDEDIAGQKAILENPKFRMALEEEYGAISSRASAAEQAIEAEKNKWTEWHTNTAVPTIDQYQKDTVEARAAAAAWEARYNEAVKQGYVPPAPGQDPANRPPANQPSANEPPAFDAKKLGVATNDDLARMAAIEGEVIAMTADLQDEYYALTGQRLYDYTTQTQDGRTLRGVRALREEARGKNLSTPQQFYDFVSGKFQFADKRRAQDEKRRLEAEEAIRKDERAKLAAEYGNPALRAPMPSRFSFIPKRPEASGQPWEKTQTQLRADRIEKALQTQAQQVH